MFVKPATIKDFDSFYSVKSEASNIYWTGWNNEPNFESLSRFYFNTVNAAKDIKNRKIYFAYEGEQIIGYFYIDYVNKETFHISPAITDKCQGKGYGKEMINHAINEGLKLGFSSAEAYIREDNIASQKCFEYNGMHKTDAFEMKYIENMQKDVKMIRYFGEFK